MLDEIIAATRPRIAHLDGAALQAAASGLPAARSLEGALAAPGLGVIAEIKRRSPSRGQLAADLRPADRAAAYAQGGAAAISVLTEPEYFSGSVEDLVAVRQAVEVPVLRKDFIVDEAQIWESRLAGADAVLLIVAALADAELAHLIGVAARAGLDALVEVHTHDEAHRAMAAGARLVGVNNRDLGSFAVDLATAESLAAAVADARVRVAESGILAVADAARMAAAGYHAVLVGEALVRADDPAALVAELRLARP
ncbi:MAG: indole-3-glycerol phosphate synthase TrpC [Acidimicrobiia bacterium]|nr:indole-3-glycerol phosphate synthase TrpC [Acidimicrobiia bacterium]